MQYRGFTIQLLDSCFLVRDPAGKIVVETESIKKAQEWIDIEKDGYEDFRELD